MTDREFYHAVLHRVAAQARRQVLGETCLGQRNGSGACSATSTRMQELLKKDGTIKALVVHGWYSGYYHTWVIVQELNLYIDPTHDQFVPEVIVRSGYLSDEDYIHNYKQRTIEEE